MDKFLWCTVTFSNIDGKLKTDIKIEKHTKDEYFRGNTDLYPIGKHNRSFYYPDVYRGLSKGIHAYIKQNHIRIKKKYNAGHSVIHVAIPESVEIGFVFNKRWWEDDKIHREEITKFAMENLQRYIDFYNKTHKLKLTKELRLHKHSERYLKKELA